MDGLQLAPMTTGSQLNSYEGNANLAFGADGNPLNPGKADIGAVVNASVKDISDKAFQFNLKKYDQAIRDRDATLALYDKGELKGDIDEVDRPELDRRYDEIQETLMKNPDIKKKPEVYGELQKKLKDFQSLNTAANTREAEFKKQRLAISETVDPELKQKMQEHLQGEMAKGISHLPTPFLKELDWNPKNFSGSEMTVVKTEQGRDKFGLPTVTETQRTNVRGIIDKYDPSVFLEGENKTLPNEAAARAKWILSNPKLTDPAYIAEANKKLAEINATNGFKPGDKYFLTPYGVQDGSTGKWEIDSNPVELNKKVHVLSEYKEVTGPAKMDAATQKALTDKAQEKQALSGAAQNYAEIDKIRALLPHQINQLESEVAKNLAAGRKDDAEALKGQIAVSKPAMDAVQTFVQVSDLNTFKPLSDVGGITPKMKADLGLTDDLLVTAIPMTNEGARKALATQEKQGTKMIPMKPDQMFAIKDPKNPDNVRIVGVRGSKITTLDLNQAVNQTIAYETGYSPGKDKVNLESSAYQFLNGMQGTTNEPLSLTKIRERANMGVPAQAAPATSTSSVTPKAAPQAAPAKVKMADLQNYKTIKAVPPEKVVNGKVYIDGAWHQVRGITADNKTMYID